MQEKVIILQDWGVVQFIGMYADSEPQPIPSPHLVTRLPPANPIYTKPVSTQQPKPVFRFESSPNPLHLKKQLTKSSDSLVDSKRRNHRVESLESICTDNTKKLYQKFDNSKYNLLREIQYPASFFISRTFLLENKKLINGVSSLLRLLQAPSKKPTHERIMSQVESPTTEVVFDSHFQSGNLFSATESSRLVYDLVLQNDINSKGNTQWFYFSVTNLPKDTEVTFNILNLLKADSLFNYGMQPVVFSRIRNKMFGEEWKREGRAITYRKGSVKRENTRRSYFTLSFRIRSRMEGDTLLIAHCFPYTYTMLQLYFSSLLSNPFTRELASKATLSKSIAQHNIDVLTITNNPKDEKEDRREIILVMARQHAGETQGSYVCEGLMQYLLGTTKEAEFLRENYVVKVIPMLNPDGVVFGNYRTNLVGVDLNRKWQKPGDSMAPEVNEVKTYIQSLARERRIRMVIDLHGHSKKLGSFFYGQPKQEELEEPRLYPFICSKLNKQVVFKDCTFSVSEEKRTSARVYLSQVLGIPSVYTFESSFYGFREEGRIVPFGVEEYKKLGETLCEGLVAMLKSEIKQDTPSTYKEELQSDPSLLKVGEEGESGSDSKPDESQLTPKDSFFIQHPIPNQPSPSDHEETHQSIEHPTTNIPKRIETNQVFMYKIERSKFENGIFKEVYSKARRRLKEVLPMNQINSTSPNKYELALKPLVTPSVKIRLGQKVSKSVRQPTNVSVSTQTVIEKLQQVQIRVPTEHKNATKSNSLSSTSGRKALLFKLDTYHRPNKSLLPHHNQPHSLPKTSHASTQTYSSNLLRYSPNCTSHNDLSESQQTLKINTMFRAAIRPLQRLSISERACDLMKRRNLNPITDNLSVERRMDEVSRSLQVHQKFLSQNKTSRRN